MRIIIEDPNDPIVVWTVCVFAAALTGNQFLLGIVWGQVPANLRAEIMKNLEQLIGAMRHPTIEPAPQVPSPPDTPPTH